MSISPPSQAAVAAAYGCCHHLLLASTTVQPSRSGRASLALALRSLPLVGHSSLRSRRRFACRAVNETEPEHNEDDEGKRKLGDDALSPSVDNVAEGNGPTESDSNIDDLSHASPEER